MGDLYVAEPPHFCPTPITGGRNILFTLAARPAGSVWQCDECAKIWEARQTPFGPTWFEATKETRERFERAARQVTS